MIKKLLALLLAFVMTMSLGASAFAVESEAVDAPDSINASVIGGEDEIMSRDASFSISFTNLGANRYVAYDGPFNLDGNELLDYVGSWAPTAQDIKIGLYNIGTDVFYTVVISGGNVDAGLRIRGLNITPGAYKVVVINPYGATYNVSGTINFSWG